jgi:hypothetical protein
MRPLINTACYPRPSRNEIVNIDGLKLDMQVDAIEDRLRYLSQIISDGMMRAPTPSTF